MEKYEHLKIEKKWQTYWQKEKVFEVDIDEKKKKFYGLDMFPYPSSAGLHVGHPEGYTATDIVTRFRRMKYGENILQPMGFDGFGLPAENYALKVNKHPKEITEENITTFTRQLKSLGFGYDWSRQVVTSRPDYYKWTQWMFTVLYKMGLAYKKEAPVNWCGSCQTVLAREQVVEGKCERCKNQVVQRNLKQWFFKITDYAEELLSEVNKLDWPEPIKLLQKNWIGKSEGAEVKFQISNFKFQNKAKTENLKNENHELVIFTTRPDTLFGATFMVVAPEHPIIRNQKSEIRNQKEVFEYIEKAKKKNELERTDLNKDKTGVELKGIKAINPVNGEEIPIFTADYVMMNYGTGAIMAVPAHDERDWKFAKKYRLPIIQVVEEIDHNNEIINYKLQITNKSKIQISNCFMGEGRAINSGEFNGLTTEEFKERIIKWLEDKNLGKKAIQYKLRDWLISRQRYWGAPIPIIYCERCGEGLVPEKDLPVELPDDVDFRPTGESPLARSEKFKKVKCPACGASEGVRREADTMDTFVCSSWYFLRYADPKNKKKPFDKKKVGYWLPVDLYVGGAEHAVMHLMYARFFTKALADAGYLNFREPFLKLRNQGMILAEDGKKMSKSLGNVINPDEVIREYGADTMRMYEMFMGPLEDAKPWNTRSIIGIRRFLEKTWNLFDKIQISKSKNQIKAKFQKPKLGVDNLDRLIHQTIKKVTEDIEAMKFNTAISQLMILVNEMEKLAKINVEKYQIVVLLLAPFAPHIAEELWEKLGRKKSIILERWPEYNKELIIENESEIVVQVNGKLRDRIKVLVGITEAEVNKLASESEKIKKWTAGKEIKKVIYVKGRLINIVV